MGLLSSIGKVVKAVTAPVVSAAKSVVTAVVKSPVGKVMNIATVAIAHPIATVSAVISKEKTVAQVVEKHFDQPLSSQLLQTAVGTAEIAGAVYAGGMVATAYSAGTLGSAIAGAVIPTTFKGLAMETAVVGAALIAAPIILESPTARKVAANIPAQLTPEGLVQTGSQVSDFIDNPSSAKLTQIAKDNPALLAIIAAAVVVAGGAALNVYNTWKMKQSTEDIAKATEKLAEQGALHAATAGGLVPEKTMATDEGIPKTNETATITTGKRRRRKAKAAIIPSMRQNVQVILSNRSIGYQINKRYLNERIFA